MYRFLLVLFTVHMAYAQNECAISGNIKLEKQNGPFKLMLRSKDQTERLASSDQQGNFSFSSIPFGSYQLQLIHKSYLIEYPEITVSDKNCQVLVVDIQLKNKKISIDEISIKAQKPSLKQELGKMTLDASKATIQQGTLQDLLTQMPGISMDNNSNISYNGKSGFRVLIDGKLSVMAESDMKSFLNSIQASSVQTIQIQNNPEAKYDAEGKGGIIAIVLKKNKKSGFNAKLNSSIGTPYNKYTSGGLFNYKKGKVNLFGSYNYQYKNMYYTYAEDRMTTLNNSSSKYTQDMRWANIDRSHNAKIGLDYDLDPKNSISFSADYTGNLSTGGNNADNISKILDVNENVLNTMLTFNEGKNVNNNLQVSLTYKHQFDSLGKEIQWDGVYTYLNAWSRNVNQNYLFTPGGTPLYDQYYYYAPTVSNIVNYYMTKADLTLPYQVIKINTGFKNEYTVNDNSFVADTSIFGGQPTASTKYRGQFDYKENIIAGYLSGKKTIDKTLFDIGVRVEHTSIASNNAQVNRNYTNIFPNISLEYTIDSHSSFSMKYSKRIQRPSFNQLNNRIVFYSKYTANVGDPKIQPSISDIFSILYSRQMSSFVPYFSLGADFNFDHNNIQEVNYIDSNLVSYFTSGNIGTARVMTLTASIQMQWGKNVSLMLTPNYSFAHFDNYRNGLREKSVGDGIGFFSNLNITLPYQIKLSFNSWMYTNMVWAQGNSDFFGSINGSISKTFLNNKLNIEISCQDILNSNTWIGYQRTSTLSSRGVWKPETRIGYLNVSYTFGGTVRDRNVEKNNRINASSR